MRFPLIKNKILFKEYRGEFEGEKKKTKINVCELFNLVKIEVDRILSSLMFNFKYKWHNYARNGKDSSDEES